MLPKEIKEVLSLLNKHQFQAYAVGGAVRDILLGKTPHDYDITTDATIEKLQELFKDFHIVNTGLQHGTLTLLINHEPIEITTFRGNSKNLKDDLLKRDFTINTLCMDKNEEIIDLLDGQKALQKNEIMVCNETSLKDDPLRILRAIRFASTFHFSISDETKKGMFLYKDELKKVSVERIAHEFSLFLISDHPVQYLDEYIDIFLVFIEEIKPMLNFNQYNNHHIYDVFHHTLKVIENTTNSLIPRLAALFHDIGKPACFTKSEDGIGHFYGHPVVSEKITRKVLGRLKFSNETIRRTCKLVYYHDFPWNENEKALKRFLSKFTLEDIDLLYELKKADAIAQNSVYLEEKLTEIEKAYQMILKIKEENSCFTRQQLNIHGDDLIDLGLRGKQIGSMLDKLIDEVIDEKIKNERAALLAYVQKESEK